MTDTRANQRMGSFAYLLAFLLSFLISGPFEGAKADTCARDWLQYQGNCYGYFEQKMTWEEAEIDCQSYHRGAHLASILTVSEALVAANHIAAYQIEPSNVWIGLHDIRHNGKWRWSDESTYNYKAWMTGRPDNYGKNEYCVELVYFANKAALPDGEERQQAAERVSPLSFSHHIKLQGFTKWNDAPCQRLNGYICKHEL
ncbi:C-type lectin Cal-like [Anolis sagrei]|uniref:C-type lectin Cal-like n=1 Tax=Anolis sagrei TaxID=38937 RepID=UPI003520B863